MSRRNASESPSLQQRIKSRIEFGALRGLLGLLGRVPLRAFEPLAGGIGWFLSRILPLGRAAVRENLAIAFPERSEAERERIVRATYRNTLLLLLEVARLPRVQPAELNACLAGRVDMQVLDPLLAQGKGLVFMTAHIGNWEWMGSWCSGNLQPLGVVYKPLHNPLINEYMTAMRNRVGMLTFSTREAVPRAMVRHLRAGGALALLPDQDAGRRGVYIDFFGRPASTNLGPALLAIRNGMTILPTFCLRVGPGRFKAWFGDPILPDTQAPDAEAEAARLMERYHRELERVIREHPEQYFWWHRRWKTRPRPKDRVLRGGKLQSGASTAGTETPANQTGT